MIRWRPDLIVIGVGANLGAERARVRRFRRVLTRLRGPGVTLHVAPVVRSPAQVRVARDGLATVDDAAPSFLNTVVVLDGTAPQAPAAWLKHLLTIEAALGRTRAHLDAPRTIDLDLLFVGDTVVDDPGPPAVHVPHPRWHQRAFVVAPLRMLFGDDACLPGTAVTLGALARASRDQPWARTPWRLA